MGPTGPEGWGIARPRPPYVRCTQPTHSGPCRASGARFAGWACSSSSRWASCRVAGWARYYPPGYTHPGRYMDPTTALPDPTTRAKESG